MSGSYIDPCESGAYQGSGSVGSEGSGSWNGSGSGNDSITSENCCPQPAAGVACCIPGSLKMRLYQIVPSSYEDPESPVTWMAGHITESRIYTLTKTVFCADTNSKTEQWVITDPDSTFGDWGDLTGAYFTSGDHGNKAFYTGYSLVLPNSPVIRISDLLVQCRCQICTHCTQEDGSKANVLPECKGCFLARGVEPLRVGDQGTIWGSAFSNYSLPGLSGSLNGSGGIHRHNVMIWGASTDLESCFGISDQPPSFLTTQKQEPTVKCNLEYNPYLLYTTQSFSSYGVPEYWKRVAFAFGRVYSSDGPTASNWHASITFPPYYHYVDCRWPAIKGSPGVPGDQMTTNEIRGRTVRYGSQWGGTIYGDGRWVSGLSYIFKSINNETALDYHSANYWQYVPTKWWTTGGRFTYPSKTITGVTMYPYSEDLRILYSNSFNGVCISVPKSVVPVYDVLYHPVERACTNTPQGIYTQLYDTPCEERVSKLALSAYFSAAENFRVILTETPACAIAPPVPPPLPPPASGSTPSPIGSEPGSGSSGSGSGGSSEPIVCAGNCEYQIYYRELNQDLTWTLMYRLWNNDCRLSCRCDGEQEITVTYVGEPYQWPNELFFPCVATTSGSTPGSTSEA